MITWVTPAGSIGNFLEQEPISFTFQATTNIAGNTILYTFDSGYLPPGLNAPLQIQDFSGTLFGILGPTTDDFTTTFTVKATEYDSAGNLVEYSNRTFSITVKTQRPTWDTPAGNIGVFVEEEPIEFTFAAAPSNPSNVVRYYLISGLLPTDSDDVPLSLNQTTGLLSGIAEQVSILTPFTFTIRAYEYTVNGSTLTPTGFFSDRTFTISISGTTIPVFLTKSGIIGTIPDSVYYSYQIQFSNPDPGTTATISVALGELPPGLEINTTGFIAGYPAPPLADYYPTTTSYTFTLQLTSESGVSFNQYTIVVFNQDFNLLTLLDTTGPIISPTSNGITKTSPAVVTTETPHGLVTGQKVALSGVIGLTQIENGLPVSLVNYSDPNRWVNPAQTIPDFVVFYARVTTEDTFQLYQDSELTSPLDLTGSTIPPYANDMTTSPARMAGIAIRTPVILNNQPLVIQIPESYPNAQFYFTGPQIASVAQGTNFGFKFIGYDFEDRQIEYVIPNVVSFGLDPNPENGWINGTLPIIGGIVKTYSFVAQVRWVSNPNVVSNQYRFTIEVIGDIDSVTSWITDSNLGNIDNTTISTKSVVATNTQNLELNYRIVGVETAADLSSIVSFNTGTAPVINTLIAVGYDGAYISSSSDVQTLGEDWTENAPLLNDGGYLNDIYFTNQPVSTNNQLVILGSYFDYPVFQVSSDRINWITVILPLSDSEPQNGEWTNITQGFGSSDYIVVGSYGRIFTAPNNAGPLQNLTWTQRASGVTRTLNSVTRGGTTETYVAVGDNATIVTSFDMVTWTSGTNTIVSKTDTSTTSILTLNSVANIIVGYGLNGSGVTLKQNGSQPIVTAIDNIANTVTVDYPQPAIINGQTVTFRVYAPLVVNLNGVTWTGTNFVAVGDTGYIIYSVDGITWELIESPTLNSLWFVYSITIDSYTYVFAGGDDGTLLQSNDHGLTWFDTEQPVTKNALRDAFYYYNDNRMYVVGDGGAILTGVKDPDTNTWEWDSDVLGRLPSNLSIALSGDIVGRVNYNQPDGTPWSDNGTKFNFRVQAYTGSIYNVVAVRDFTLTVNRYFTSEYQNLYIQAYPSLKDRSLINQLLGGVDIIPQTSLYRPDDPYFGKASVVRYEHLYGVDKTLIQNYYDNINENHYRRLITLGELKTAVALDEKGNVLYEVVYSEIIDNLVNNQGFSIPKQITWPRNIPQLAGPWYTSTTQVLDSFTFYDPNPIYGRLISNGAISGNTLILNAVTGIEPYMQLTGPGVANTTVANVTVPPSVVSVVVNSNNTVSVNLNQSQANSTLVNSQLVFFNNPAYTSLTNDPYEINTLYPASLINMRLQIADRLGQINDARALPLWMSSRQPNGKILGYTAAWVICYVKPGLGEATKNRINTLLPFTLNQINFEVDRFEVDNTITANPPTDSNENDWYIIFSQKNILPNSTT